MFASDSMKPPLQWRHVVITGAAQGLGRALSELCAAQGMQVHMIDSNEPALNASSRSLRNQGMRVHPVLCDVSSGEETARAFASIRAAAGSIDALICCAAVGDSEWKRSFEARRLERVLDVNVMGIARCMEQCLPGMHASGGGTVVLVSSLLDARGYAGTASYSASKAALRALAESARVLLASSGISVVLVRPGFMRTAMTAGNSISMPGMVSAEDAASRILYGIIRGRTVISFPWWMSTAASLARLLPRPMFDALVRMGMRMDKESDDLTYTPAAAKEPHHEH